jgi:hypothetical protein
MLTGIATLMAEVSSFLLLKYLLTPKERAVNIRSFIVTPSFLLASLIVANLKA